MKKRIIPKILFAAAIILSLGIGVAYYNTSTLGYDNANIISFDEEKVNIFDYEIRYKDIKKAEEKIKDLLHDDFIVI